MLYKLNYKPSINTDSFTIFEDHHTEKFKALSAVPSGKNEHTIPHTGPFNQLSLGSCVCNASVGAMETLLFNMDSNRYNIDFKHSRLSRLFLYYTCRVHDGTVDKDEGTYLNTVAYVLQELGICAEELWSYDKDTISTKVFIEPILEAFIRASENRIGGTLKIVNNDATINKMVAAINANHPVIFGALVTEDFASNIGTKDIIYPPSANEIFAGGHAQCCLAAKQLDNNEYIFLVRNSWGIDFGIDGYSWFHQSYFTNKQLTNEILVFTTAEFLK